MRAKQGLLLTAAISAYLVSPAAFAQTTNTAAASGNTAAGDEIIVTGTRRSDLKVNQLATPIDVYKSEDLEKQASGDVLQILGNLNPSFDIRYYPTADGSAFVRPPTLRNLPPDNILVLLNGKRYHRSALLQTSGALSGGSQGPDLATLPSIAFETVEVLRDGASALYGSDAIAGVINFRLKQREGIEAIAQYGEFYAGDGAEIKVAANAGIKVGETGFVNLSAEYRNANETSRGAQRPAAVALAAAFPGLPIDNPVQIWGNPIVDSMKVLLNSGFDISDDAKFYLVAGYSRSKNDTSFNWRQPRTITAPNAAGTGTVTFGQNGAYNPIYTTINANGEGLITGGIYSFSQLYPGGFTPRFGATLRDATVSSGIKGTVLSDLTYDVSGTYGMSKVHYRMNNSVNPSLGPLSPTRFDIGRLEEHDTAINADFTYPINIGLEKPIIIAFGAEHRSENYLIKKGEPASYIAGPYARVPLINANGTPALGANGQQIIAIQSVGTSGFVGFSPKDEIDNTRKSNAFYVDIEGDVAPGLSLGIAGRYEHFSDFGSSTTGKISGRYAFNDAIAIRGTASTGFRAPSPAQLFTRSTGSFFSATATNAIEVQLLPTTNPAAIYFGAKPLKPERSTNFSGGLVITPSRNLAMTIDAYQVKVRNRIAFSRQFQVANADRPALQALGVPDFATIGSVQYFSNAFDTRSRGVEAMVSHDLKTEGAGNFNTTLSASYSKTNVIKFDPLVVNAFRIGAIENINPKFRAILTENWSIGAISTMVRARYYGSYKDYETTGAPLPYGSNVVFDAEIGAKLGEHISVAVGADNIFDKYPGKIPNAYVATGGQSNGQIYPFNTPFSYNGGFYYLRVSGTF